MKLKFLATALAVIILSTATNNVAFAANYGDTGYSYRVGTTYTSRTEYRQKTDDSPVYVNSLSGPRQTHFYVWNHKEQQKNAGKGVAITEPGNKYLVHTLIWEHRDKDGNTQYGQTICALASKYNPFDGQSTGVWSPDSIGSYPFAN